MLRLPRQLILEAERELMHVGHHEVRIDEVEAASEEGF